MGPLMIGPAYHALEAQSMSGPVCAKVIRRRTNLNTVLDLDAACVAVLRMRLSMAGFRSSLPFSALIRQVEQEMETVVKVLQPGPLGIIEHKFSADEIRKANATVSKAVSNWRTNVTLENNDHILKDYIYNK